MNKLCSENKMDTYKIVATSERNGKNYTNVPHHWEKDNILYWPPTNTMSKNRIKKLQMNAASIPAINWEKSACIVKVEKIASWAEAVAMVKEIVKASGTESEEILLDQMKREKRLCRVKSGKDAKYQNYNNLIHAQSTPSATSTLKLRSPSPTSSSSQSSSPSPTPTPSSTHTSPPPPLTDSTLSLLPESNSLPLTVMDDPITNEMKDDHVYLVSVNQVSEMQTELQTLKQILEINHKISNIKLDQLLKIVAEQSTKLDLFEQMLTNQGKEVKEVCDFPTHINLPVASLEEMEELELKLKTDANYRKQIISIMVNLGGGCASGKEDGSKIGRKIIYNLFTTQLLRQFSWTGIFKKNLSHVPKLSFQKYPQIILIFCDVLYKADDRHNKIKNDEFFKDVLKYVERRDKKKRTDKDGTVPDPTDLAVSMTLEPTEAVFTSSQS